MRLYLFTEAKFDEDASVVSKDCNNKRFKLNHDDTSKSDQVQPSTSTTKESSNSNQPSTSMPKDSSKSEQPSTSTNKDNSKFDQLLSEQQRTVLNQSPNLQQTRQKTMTFYRILSNHFKIWWFLKTFREADEEIEFHVTDEEKQMQRSLLDNFNELNETLQNEFVVLKLHGGHVLNELEDFFMQKDFNMRHHKLQIKMIWPNGETESAEDSA